MTFLTLVNGPRTMFGLDGWRLSILRELISTLRPPAGRPVGCTRYDRSGGEPRWPMPIFQRNVSRESWGYFARRSISFRLAFEVMAATARARRGEPGYYDY